MRGSDVGKRWAFRGESAFSCPRFLLVRSPCILSLLKIAAYASMPYIEEAPSQAWSLQFLPARAAGVALALGSLASFVALVFLVQVRHTLQLLQASNDNVVPLSSPSRCRRTRAAMSSSPRLRLAGTCSLR